MTHCSTCPRALTPQEHAAKLRTCEVCRGVRRGPTNTFPHRFKHGRSVHNGLGRESWWVGLGREELNREAHRRFPGNEPIGLVMNDKGYFETGL